MEKMIDLIPEFISFEEQVSTLGNNEWSVARLCQLSKDFKIMEIPLEHLSVYYTYEVLTLREMVMHMKTVEKADLTKPIILDEDGELMDGRHRLMKALFLGVETIKVVRFKKNPRPCRRNEGD